MYFNLPTNSRYRQTRRWLDHARFRRQYQALEDEERTLRGRQGLQEPDAPAPIAMIEPPDPPDPPGPADGSPVFNPEVSDLIEVPRDRPSTDDLGTPQSAAAPGSAGAVRFAAGVTSFLMNNPDDQVSSPSVLESVVDRRPFFDFTGANDAIPFQAYWANVKGTWNIGPGWTPATVAFGQPPALSRFNPPQVQGWGDQSIETEWLAGSGGIAARLQSGQAANCYFLTYRPLTQDLVIGKMAATFKSDLAIVPFTVLAPGDKIKLALRGSQLTAFVNGVQVQSVSDPDYAYGFSGVFGEDLAFSTDGWIILDRPSG